MGFDNFFSKIKNIINKSIEKIIPPIISKEAHPKEFIKLTVKINIIKNPPNKNVPIQSKDDKPFITEPLESLTRNKNAEIVATTLNKNIKI